MGVGAALADGPAYALFIMMWEATPAQHTYVLCSLIVKLQGKSSKPFQ